MTLVEVVAGLALLGSVLVGLLLTRTALMRQRIAADERLAAVHACDQLLAQWRAEGREVPVSAWGLLGDDDRFRWSTHLAGTQRIEPLAVDVVQLDVAKTGEERQPLASVELLVGRERTSP
jgi:type II secretory pathway pseudopilin PulG